MIHANSFPGKAMKVDNLDTPVSAKQIGASVPTCFGRSLTNRISGSTGPGLAIPFRPNLSSWEPCGTHSSIPDEPSGRVTYAGSTRPTRVDIRVVV